VAKDKRPDNPPASTLTSIYLHHVFVSAVYSNVSQDQMTETAAHMSHTVTSDETHYEAHGALQLTSRANISVVIIQTSTLLLVCCVVQTMTILKTHTLNTAKEFWLLGVEGLLLPMQSLRLTISWSVNCCNTCEMMM